MDEPMGPDAQELALVKVNLEGRGWTVDDTQITLTTLVIVAHRPLRGPRLEDATTGLPD